MRKVTALKVEYTYADTEDSEARLDRFYCWLINKAIDNLLKKQKVLDRSSTQKYTEDNGQSRGIPDTGGSSKDTQGKKDNNLQNGQKGQVTGHKVWQGLENKQQKINGAIGG